MLNASRANVAAVVPSIDFQADFPDKSCNLRVPIETSSKNAFLLLTFSHAGVRSIVVSCRSVERLCGIWNATLKIESGVDPRSH